MEEQELVNKPALYDLNEDYAIISPQYKKEYGTNLIEDAYRIDFIDFYNNINSLGGKIPDILSLRARYMSGEKMEKHERNVASSLLTSDQEKYIKEKSDFSKSREMDMVEDIIIAGILN